MRFRKGKMINLLEETLGVMYLHGKSKEDIAWIGCEEFSIPTELFYKLADVEYDNGFGWAEVPLDLQIVFNDNSMLYRYEYDGAEKWMYITPVKPQREMSNINNLVLSCTSLRTLMEKSTNEDE